jgi:hypothetical protein
VILNSLLVLEISFVPVQKQYKTNWKNFLNSSNVQVVDLLDIWKLRHIPDDFCAFSKVETILFLPTIWFIGKKLSIHSSNI